MGVLLCSRGNCENIMCDTYIPDFGYLCFECQAEFKKFVRKPIVTEEELKLELMAFKETNKNSTQGQPGVDIDEFFKRYTR